MNMKLILVTPPSYFVEEDKIITALFEEGLDMLHLRKPDTPPMFAERLLTLIPEQYHKRIVVHGHFYLKEEFRLKGIHLNERNPQPPERYKGHLSCTCHSLEEVKQKKSDHDYVFLYPVFNSISSVPQLPALTPEALHQAHRDGLIDKHVIAFGGINEENILSLKCYGFGGAALMTDIWSRFDRCSAHDFSELIAHFKRIKKLVD
jgi:thiamine-phosphate pyrophosphorylase